MRVALEGIGELRFWFKHTPKATVIFCTVGDTAPIQTHSHLARGDSYCKATGRRIALTRLLGWGMVLSREQRKLIWAEYFKQHADLKK
jgi:hypothetical protein